MELAKDKFLQQQILSSAPVINKPLTSTGTADSNSEAPESSEISPRESVQVKEYPQGSVKEKVDLGLDNIKNLSQEEAGIIANQFGFESVKELQSFVGVKADGIMGKETINAFKGFLDNNISDLKEKISQELPQKMEVESLSEAQDLLGVDASGELDEETVNQMADFFDTNSLIMGTINTMLKAKEFESMIKVLQIQLQNMDTVLNLIRPE